MLFRSTARRKMSAKPADRIAKPSHAKSRWEVADACNSPTPLNWTTPAPPYCPDPAHDGSSRSIRSITANVRAAAGLPAARWKRRPAKTCGRLPAMAMPFASMGKNVLVLTWAVRDSMTCNRKPDRSIEESVAGAALS